MDKTYNPSLEENIYSLWETAGIFTPVINKTKTPYTIILPPPNANDPLHAGHALYVVEDILIRFHRMLGDPTLWLPGTDHAGIETQFVFEKKLQKDGQSRFDFDRETLFKMIDGYVKDNSAIAVTQLKRLGFSLDWTRLKFTLDEDHNQRIFAVFRKMFADGLIYRGEKIVNYCTRCGTSFSNLEVDHKMVDSSLWYFKYGPLVVATTRPETMLGDTAVAVNPSDPRYQKLIGTTITLPLVGKQIPVIGEDSVDPKFGTGAVKITPSHSPEDYTMAQTHGLQFIRIFDYDGKANQNVPAKYRGLFPNQLRKAVVVDMAELGLVDKIVPYSHEVGHCYRCGQVIEPITAPQWYITIKPLADAAITAVKADQVIFFPPRFKKEFLSWMKDIYDWPISRQIVWGQRIPVWYNLDDNSQIIITFIGTDGKIVNDTWANLQGKVDFEIIKSGLQTLLVPADIKYYLSEESALQTGPHILQETDTFDTWFSSGQWPYSTLGWSPDGHHSEDFKYFYPTAVLDTMWDILFFWVARMIMLGIYATGEVPFKVAHMHSRVVDAKGQKMSKSKGNVINPVAVAEANGADALRLALVYGVAPGSDIPLSDDKIRAQRNFVNKIWNASRFVMMTLDKFPGFEAPILQGGMSAVADKGVLNADDISIISKLNLIIKSTTTNINKYRFGQASEDLYQFFWHEFCDEYIEETKNRIEEAMPTLKLVLLTSLKLIHPFAPFVTESIYQEFKEKYNLPDQFLAISPWPTLINEK